MNYFSQRFITKKFPCSKAKFTKAASTAKEHIDILKRHLTIPLEYATFYEFGAGWDLIGPLTFYACGDSVK